MDDGRKRTLPGGAEAWTVTEIANDYGPVDWYPGDHPKMPKQIVAHGGPAPRHPCVRPLSFPERHG